MLDEFGAAEKGHTAAARHLRDDHGIPGWHSQGITVAYERARGLRAANQRMSGEYEVSISKVVAGAPQAIAREFTKRFAKAAAKPFVIRENGRGHLRHKDGSSTVDVMLTPKNDGKVSVVVTCLKLPDGAAVERRAHWRAALDELA